MADFRPETVKESERWKLGTGMNPAKYLIPDSELRYARPMLRSGSKEFVWPVGIETFRHSGNALLGVRRYIGDNAADVQVVHKDEARIEMTGTFPGTTAVACMIALKDVILAETPDRGKILFLPGVFEEVKYVAVESYDFNHSEDDRTHSIDYTITFVIMGTGFSFQTPNATGTTTTTTSSPVVTATRPLSPGGRILSTTGGASNFQHIAKIVYGNPDKWPKLVDLNQALFATIPAKDLPFKLWTEGIEIRY